MEPSVATASELSLRQVVNSEMFTLSARVFWIE